jgi:hypothetical protein
MSNVSINENGSLSLVLTNQAEFTEAELKEIQRLRELSSNLMLATRTLSEKEKSIQTALLDNPQYVQLLKIQEKKKIARKLKNETELYLANEVNKAFRKNNPNTDLADVVASMLPTLPEKSSTKRGRPRKLGA